MIFLRFEVLFPVELGTSFSDIFPENPISGELVTVTVTKLQFLFVLSFLLLIFDIPAGI